LAGGDPAGRDLDWRTATLEDVAGYVAWLRLPPEGRDGRVQGLPSVAHHCSAGSVNRKLAALTSLREFHARHGVALAGLLVSMAPPGRGRSWSVTSFKPFLQHIVKHGEQRCRRIKLSSPQPRPRVLTTAEAQTILDGCGHLRDRLMFAVLLDTGMRFGEALGLRHEDLDIAGCQVAVASRVNDNRARVKGGRPRFIPTGRWTRTTSSSTCGIVRTGIR
jgi:integrase/recombinase XerD